MLSKLMKESKDTRLPDSQLREIMVYANAAGALTCTNPGVIPALPTAADIERFLDK
jgi:sugar/nucleoside kinase (ribokinase family)